VTRLSANGSGDSLSCFHSSASANVFHFFLGKRSPLTAHDFQRCKLVF
jgi:hypothetical protein